MKNSSNKSFWQSFGLFFYKRSTLAMFLWLAVVVFGSLSYSVWMRREGFPSVNVPLGAVQIISFEQTAEQVDKNFVQPLLEQAKKDKSVKDAVSSSSDIGASIQISFNEGSDVQKSLDLLKSGVEGRLPKNAEVFYIKINASKLTPEGDDVLISVHGAGLSPAQLDESAKKLLPILEQRLKLAEKVHVYNLVESVVDDNTGETTSAQVRFDRFLNSDTNGSQPSVIVGVGGKSGVDQLKLFDEIEATLNSDEAKSIGASSAISSDYAESIREQVSGLQSNLLEGLLVVLIVSFILISLRGSVVTALAMSTTVIGTIAILKLIGFSINTITLFSLVLCLALIVDDTTIVVEAIDAGLKKKKNYLEVVSDALRKVARASSTGTLVTILAFAPMLFIGGVLGEFIRAIPITIIISLIVSLLVSFMFIPALMTLTFGRRNAHKPRSIKVVARAEETLSVMLSSALRWSVKTTKRSVATKLGAVLVSLLFIAVGGMFFRQVEFNIFPAPKDGINIIFSAEVKNKETAVISETEKYTDKLLAKTKEVVGKDLKRLSLSGLGAADRDGFNASILLSSLDDREKTSVQIAEELQASLENLVPEMRVNVESAGVGPPEGNFTVQIRGEDADKSLVLANEVSKFLSSAVLTRPDKTTSRLTNVQTTPRNLVLRDNNERVVNVTAGFEGKDVSALVELAENAVKNEFTPELVSSFGLPENALGFDFGQEEENQKSFESMGKAAGPLFLAMFIVMAILFKSLTQPLLILTALPFALFGVATGLLLTDNPLSFFSMLGVFALIGISLNNTILLTDYANQGQKEGQSPVNAMSGALKNRLRPLLTTSVTSVLALLPLALNDPFWEGLAYTLIFGLLSSTVLVLLVFPYFYLIEETLRSKFLSIFRRQ